MKKKVFISFDYDHDLSQKNLLVGQSKLDDSPFEISDVSIKQEIESDWESKAKQKIKNADVVLVLCGFFTDNATGVSKEIEIAREVGTKYYLLKAYDNKTPYKPKASYSSDIIHDWTWNYLKRLLG